ncbi:TadE/TadG family type IV pilus assembly protein [Desulfitobacterium metallireducens]|uniref:Putative Flp pilus-assembly TadG-like N-terminal domain-containing protein n=1 Tax=Desulfitobacterium metallireducens DSM 15288 TaxID=871968 RepID=W0E7X7_9FIRM|nr:TadE/TadG family type IV pilus assembly protein [Desulfitobacterium metallireducens]AHF06872.1 hypothetical protein DESME_07185 [Desulfitobacterium metallireducens DSM 15288]
MAIWTQFMFLYMKLARSHVPEPEINSSERGSIVILVALGMTVLLGSCAMVADIGLLYVQKARLQNAVDSAALAGVQELPGDTNRANQVAEDYASQNGVNNITTRIEANNFEIAVAGQKTVPTSFAKLWGINEEQISANSAAMMVPPSSLSGAVPLSIQEQDFQYGALYTLKTGSGNQITGEIGGQYYGWFGPLDLTGGGASDYEASLTNNYQGSLSIGQFINTENGNMSGPTKRAVETRLASDTRVPPNTFDNHDRNAPEIIYVPIVKFANSDLNAVYQVQITGFAAFFLEGVSGNGTDSIITGRFIKTLITSGKTGGTLAELLKQEEDMKSGTSGIDYGLYAPKLVAN